MISGYSPRKKEERKVAAWMVEEIYKRRNRSEGTREPAPRTNASGDTVTLK